MITIKQMESWLKSRGITVRVYTYDMEKEYLRIKREYPKEKICSFKSFKSFKRESWTCTSKTMQISGKTKWAAMLKFCLWLKEKELLSSTTTFVQSGTISQIAKGIKRATHLRSAS